MRRRHRRARASPLAARGGWGARAHRPCPNLLSGVRTGWTCARAHRACSAAMAERILETMRFQNNIGFPWDVNEALRFLQRGVPVFPEEVV